MSKCEVCGNLFVNKPDDGRAICNICELKLKDQKVINLQSQLAEKEKYTYTGKEVGKIEQNYDNQLAIIEKALELACKELGNWSVKVFMIISNQSKGDIEK